MLCIILATSAKFDDVFAVLLSGQPEKPLLESFADEGPGSGVMPAITKVDFLEDINALFLCDALLEYA